MSKIKDALEKAKRLRGVPNPFALIEDETGVKDDAAPQAAKTKKIINYSPDAILQHNIITLTADHYELSERFKLFKTQILTKTQISGDRTILVTSCTDGEGKTFTAVNLAITLAREIDQSVLLVDVNFRHPSVISAFGIQRNIKIKKDRIHPRPFQIPFKFGKGRNILDRRKFGEELPSQISGQINLGGTLRI